MLNRFAIGAVAGVMLTTGLLMILPSSASAAACSAPSTDYGRASVTLNVSSAAIYRIWTRILVPDSSNNSFLLEVDGSTCFTVGDGGLSPNAWTWIDYQNGSVASKIQMNLTAGSHTLKMIGREPGVKLGRLLLISNLNCIPVNNGDNCATTSAPSDTEGPSVDITAPVNGANVKGIVPVNVTARDNVSVAKVDFFINGVLKSSDMAAPYTYDWDTKVTANGKINVMAKAYDISGNVNSDSVQVTVAGGDAQAPSVPGNVSAVVDSTNKVTVKWAASTDNIGVAGYRILRNSVIVGQAMGLDYIDGTTLPGTTYNYQVAAFDQAGNSSNPSVVVEVKTAKVADSQPPAPPANLKAVSVNPNQINLSWTASSDNIGVAAYDVFRSTGKGAAIKVATVSKTGFGDTGLTPATKYNYYIVAKDSALNASEKSAIVSVQTLANPIPVTGMLRGKVTFAKNAQSQAHVIIRVKGIKHIYDTDSQGNYEISKLPPGNYKVTYRAEGSHTKELTAKIQAKKITTMDVALLKR
ncbi:MAG TPA: Ig-like domain-containing protein [Candidatus Saccharimonadales bacterium]